MADFAFVVSTGASRPADTAVRSHAVKTALKRRSKTVAKGGSEAVNGVEANSKRTAQSKRGLKGQFRLGTVSIKSYTPGTRPTDNLWSKTGEATFQGTFSDAVPDKGRKEAMLANVKQCHFSSKCAAGIEWLEANALDPFGTIPISSNCRVDALLKHCITHSPPLSPYVAIAHIYHL